MDGIESLTYDEFLGALHRGTDGLWSLESAIWLLDQHGVWLNYPNIRNYVSSGYDEAGKIWAGLNIPEIDVAIERGEFVRRDGDISVLRVAMSLYGDYRISLRYNVENVTPEDLALIGESLKRACGYF
ncbi:hypothetical protein ACFTXM_47145 [Streptomyces sp. NPDC056930]|uniref:hypothetical protein n=1 Tax=Streptomyces sp. NPDC056930 TaxID=3345967 RepID=UPI00363ECB65